jgi:hypothetical protein
MKFHPAFTVIEATICDMEKTPDGHRIQSRDLHVASIIWSKHPSGKIHLHKCRSSRFPKWVTEAELERITLECYSLFLADMIRAHKEWRAKQNRIVKSARRELLLGLGRRELVQHRLDALKKQNKRLIAKLK